MKKLLSALFILVFVLVGCSSASNSELQKVTLLLDYLPNTNHTGIYVANELGYYEQMGIDLEIVAAGEIQNEALLAQGEADFAVSYGEALAQFEQSSSELTSIMSVVETNTSGFLSLKEKNITSPKDFENKTYCGWGSDFEAKIIESVMDAESADFSTVENIASGSASLTSPDTPCDFMWAFAGWDKISLEQSGLDVNFEFMTDYTKDWYTPIIITTDELINEDPQLVQNFVSATIKGYEYAAANPEESADILIAQNPSLDPNLVKASQAYLSENYYTTQMGYQDPIVWEEFLQWLYDAKITPELLDADTLYTNEFVSGYYDQN